MRLRGSIGVLGLVVALAIGGGTNLASATGPGANGKITFRHDTDRDFPAIVSIQPDGTGRTVLFDRGYFNGPEWSVDGTRMAFVHYRHPNARVLVADEDARDRALVVSNRTLPDRWEILGYVAWVPGGDHLVLTLNDVRTDDVALFVVALDGSGLTRLSPRDVQDIAPAVSNDGSTIACISLSLRGLYRIVLMDVDGSDRRTLQVGGRAADPFHLDWAPDDSAIVFGRVDGDVDLFSVAPDGSDLVQLTHGGRGEGNPSFSPDGTRIVFERELGLYGLPDLWTIAAGGGDPVRLTDTPNVSERSASWQPLPSR